MPFITSRASQATPASSTCLPPAATSGPPPVLPTYSLQSRELGKNAKPRLLSPELCRHPAQLGQALGLCWLEWDGVGPGLG